MTITKFSDCILNSCLCFVFLTVYFTDNHEWIAKYSLHLKSLQFEYTHSEYNMKHHVLYWLHVDIGTPNQRVFLMKTRRHLNVILMWLPSPAICYPVSPVGRYVVLCCIELSSCKVVWLVSWYKCLYRNCWQRNDPSFQKTASAEKTFG